MRNLLLSTLAIPALIALAACGSDDKTVVVNPPSQPATVVQSPSGNTVVQPGAATTTVVTPSGTTKVCPAGTTIC